MINSPVNIPVLELKKITKTYPLRKNHKVLDAVDLTLEKGEIFVLMGANGAGKTTLLKIISYLVLPDAGSVSIAGHDVEKAQGKTKIPLSMVLGEERSFYWRLTGRQNLEFFGVLYEIPRGLLKHKIVEAAKLFEIDDLDKRYEAYSTGQKTRLALARSYLSEAEFILMDEPTKSLDHHSKGILHHLIKNLNHDKKSTFMIVTHDLQEAEILGTSFGYLKSGQLRVTRSFQNFSEQMNSSGSGHELF